MPNSTGISTIQEKFIECKSLMGVTTGYLFPASRNKILLSSFLPSSFRFLFTLLSFIIFNDCSVNSFTSFAVNTALADSSRGKHRSIFIKSVTAFAIPTPEILEYAGSVFVISDERDWSLHLILTVTLCPIVGATTTVVLGTENFIFCSISFAISFTSSLSIFLPARLSIITPSLFKVAKFPLNAKSPSLKSIPTPMASITPLPT